MKDTVIADKITNSAYRNHTLDINIKIKTKRWRNIYYPKPKQKLAELYYNFRVSRLQRKKNSERKTGAIT